MICSDCGTNFVGAVKELFASVIDVNDNNHSDFMKKKYSVEDQPYTCISHGGSWERVLGVARKIVNSLLMDHTP